MTLQKLIEDYSRKVSFCDTQIADLTEQRRADRADTLIAQELAVVKAQRQAYVQTIADLESFIDHDREEGRREGWVAGTKRQVTRDWDNFDRRGEVFEDDLVPYDPKYFK